MKGALIMILSRCTNTSELIPFLKLDYANNLYFFTYLSESADTGAVFFTLKNQDKIELVLLVSPMHCCISTANINHISALSGQLPSINSVHVVGRRDFIEPLLNICNEPERNKHLYLLNEYIPANILNSKATISQEASRSDLNELIEFYNNINILMDAGNRLPGILNWGHAYFARENNKVVSCALTTTETSDAAMIGAVFTIPQYRNRGYARDCMINLCTNLLGKNKKPYLFYNQDNTLLGSMYQSLGFHPINTWILTTLK